MLYYPTYMTKQYYTVRMVHIPCYTRTSTQQQRVYSLLCKRTGIRVEPSRIEPPWCILPGIRFELQKPLPNHCICNSADTYISILECTRYIYIYIKVSTVDSLSVYVFACGKNIHDSSQFVVFPTVCLFNLRTGCLKHLGWLLYSGFGGQAILECDI